MAFTTIDSLGSYATVRALASEPIAAILDELRALIAREHPDAVEVGRTGDRAVSYGFGEKKMSEAWGYLMPHSGWVNLGFYHGGVLPDPDGLLEGTGARLRHVKVRPGAVHAAQLETLIRNAMAERAAALGIAR